MKTRRLGNLEFEIREFTNSELLAYQAYQKSKQFKEYNEAMLKANRAMKMIPRHPVQVRVANKLKELEQRVDKYKNGLLTKNMLQKHQDELKAMALGELGEDISIGELLAKHEQQKQRVWDKKIDPEKMTEFDSQKYNIEKELLPHIDEITESEEAIEEYRNKENVARGAQFYLNRDFLYFLKQEYDPEMAQDALSAEDQFSNFMDTKDGNEQYKEFLADPSWQDKTAGKDGQEITSWVGVVVEIFTVGAIQSAIAPLNRKERRTEEAKKKSASKKDKSMNGTDQIHSIQKTTS